MDLQVLFDFSLCIILSFSEIMLSHLIELQDIQEVV